MSRPEKKIRPPWTGMRPARRLKSVVLPAPFGPMMARNSPAATARDTLSTAAIPPKLRRNPRASSARFDMPHSALRRFAELHQPVRHEKGNRQDYQPEEEQPVDGEERNRD